MFIRVLEFPSYYSVKEASLKRMFLFLITTASKKELVVPPQGGSTSLCVRRGCAPVLGSFWPENSGIGVSFYWKISVIGVYFHSEFSGIGVYCYIQSSVMGIE